MARLLLFCLLLFGCAPASTVAHAPEGTVGRTPKATPLESSTHSPPTEEAPADETPADETPATAAPESTPTDEPSALALVIDRSGSMSGAPIEQARKACHDAVDALEPDDHVVVIAFDSRPFVLVPARRLGDAVAVHAGIDRLTAGGGTEIFSALELAHQTLGAIEGARLRALLLSDGRAPVSGIAELVKAMRQDGIVVSAIGLGADFDPELLEQIAKLGGGRFRTAQAEDLPAVFRREVITLTAPQTE